MKRLRSGVCLGVLAVLASVVLAEPERVVKLTLDLTDGSRVIGTPAESSIRLVTPYATIDLSLDQVRSAEFDVRKETAVLELRNDDRLSGVADLEGFDLTTSFGAVHVTLAVVRKMSVQCFAPSTEKGLVLWNTFDSRGDVEVSRVGPNGTFRSGRFEPGLNGNALAVGPQDIDAVTFTSEILNAKAGCIEFMAKLVDFPAALAWGQNPTFFRLVAGSKHALMMHLNGNDGGGLGGLCAAISGCGRVGTGGFGDWTYARATGLSDISGWHHYALVWDRNGIPGVDNGKRAMAIYVDGELNSRAWTDPDPSSMMPFPRGEFRIMFQQHLNQGRVLFDELKVWDYARTDFGD